jgi:hypothetical protein
MNYSSLRHWLGGGGGGTVRLAMALATGLGIAAAAAGCGLISSDVTNFDLTLPDKRFTIDMGGWQVDTSAADEYLMRSCGANPGLCNTAVQSVCSMNCSGACGGDDTCELSLDISGRQPVDLVMERPELKSINDEPVIKVTIDSVTYDVDTNTLNIDTPEITLYVAPTSVIKSNDPMAKAIGTIPPIPAGTTTTSSQSVRFTPTGRADLIAAMSSFKTPFNVLVGSSIVITASQPVPTGKLDAVVHIKGHAGL